MNDDANYQFYTDLARWWPLISPPSDFIEEAAYFATLFCEAKARDVLELGSGGGSNAVHLKAEFDLVLVDLSSAMIEESRKLNPKLVHVVGDMRTVRLDRRFDAVFLHDAIDYMYEIDDLRAALATARAHLEVGGTAVIAPDHVFETFEDDSDFGGADGELGRGVRFAEWTYDPDPTDTWIETDYVFIVRQSAGVIETVAETHRTGLFAVDTWLAELDLAGFDAEVRIEDTTEDREPRRVFVGRAR